MNRNGFLNHLLRGGIAASALAVTALPAYAESGDQESKDQKDKRDKKGNKGKGLARRRGAMGTVSGLNATAKSFVLSTRRGDLTVTTDGDTVFKVRGEESATFASLANDQRVVVTGERPNETTLLAKRVMVLKAKARDEDDEKDGESGRTVTTGVVSGLAADGTSFKLTPAGGTAVTFKVTAQTEKTLMGTATFANGVTARVVSVKDEAGNNVARRIRVTA